MRFTSVSECVKHVAASLVWLLAFELLGLDRHPIDLTSSLAVHAELTGWCVLVRAKALGFLFRFKFLEAPVHPHKAFLFHGFFRVD